MKLFLLILLFFIPLLINTNEEEEEIHERNYFLMSGSNADKCREVCNSIGGFPCVEDFEVPENPNDVNDGEKYSITVVCCNKECTEPIEGNREKPLPYCDGDFLDFVC